MIGIVDYGMGNLGSILNMLKKVRVRAFVSSVPHELESASGLILPGVGAFDSAMKNLEHRGLIHLLNKQVMEKGKPILGICLGMQLFSKESEEGVLPGLGWIKADTVRLNPKDSINSLKVPHMGWNTIEIVKGHKLFNGFIGEKRFYFVHSYHMVCKYYDNVLAETSYGGSFASAICFENVLGVQFHPEKSHKFGMQLLKNFAELCKC